MPTTTTPARGIRDIVRREWFLTKLSVFLEDLPGPDRRAIYRDLRADLGAAATDVGMREAIADLGPVAVLAQGYRTAQGRKLPQWWVGALATGLLAVLSTSMLLSYTLGLHDGVAGTADGAAGGAADGATTAHGTFLWTQVVVEHGPDALSASFSGAGPLLGFPLCLAVFFVAARGWRLWIHRPARP